MFNNSKYTNWYNNIITKAKSQNRKRSNHQYWENHHVIPKSLGGNNKKDNMVLLTAKEHFICHLLLPKMCISSDHTKRMVYAYFMLSKAFNPTKTKNGHNNTSKLYELHRKAFSLKIAGTNNPNFGGNNYTEESLRKMSEAKKGKPLSETHKKNIAKALVGNTYSLGYKHSEDTKSLLSKQRIGNKNSVGKSNTKGYLWYNDGEKNIRLPIDKEVPEGFHRGQLKNVNRLLSVYSQ